VTISIRVAVAVAVIPPFDAILVSVIPLPFQSEDF
jgi:hypothetical protein